MKFTDIFKPDGFDRSRKREALRKVLAKLETTQGWLEKEIEANGSGTKRRHLDVRLRTNRKQREKTKMLIAELDQDRPAARPRSGLTGGHPLLS